MYKIEKSKSAYVRTIETQSLLLKRENSYFQIRINLFLWYGNNCF